MGRPRLLSTEITLHVIASHHGDICDSAPSAPNDNLESSLRPRTEKATAGVPVYFCFSI